MRVFHVRRFIALIVLNFFCRSICQFRNRKLLFSVTEEVIGDEEEEETLRILFDNDSLTYSQLVLLLKELSKAPFTPNFKSTFWRKILKNGEVTNLTRTQWVPLSPLIPYIPPDMLLAVHFTDEMIEYFGEQEMEEEQLSVMAEAVLSKWGDIVYSSDSHIIKMGNIFCGLSKSDMYRIQYSTFRNLLRRNFFKHVKGCNAEKLKILCLRAQSFAVLGPPRTWQPTAIESMGILLAGLDFNQIREIRSDFFHVFTPEIIAKIPAGHLLKLRPKQLQMLTSSALMAWRRKTLDVSPLYGDLSLQTRTSGSFVVCSLLFFIVSHL